MIWCQKKQFLQNGRCSAYSLCRFFFLTEEKRVFASLGACGGAVGGTGNISSFPRRRDETGGHRKKEGCQRRAGREKGPTDRHAWDTEVSDIDRKNAGRGARVVPGAVHSDTCFHRQKSQLYGFFIAVANRSRKKEKGTLSTKTGDVVPFIQSNAAAPTSSSQNYEEIQKEILCETAAERNHRKYFAKIQFGETST